MYVYVQISVCLRYTYTYAHTHAGNMSKMGTKYDNHRYTHYAYTTM